MYAQPLHLTVFHAAHALGMWHSVLAQGAYAWVSGLTYKTHGEAVLLAAAGMTVVGMSTVPEVMVAHNEGIRVLMLSLVTNMVVGVFPGIGVKSMREELNAKVLRGLGWLGVCWASDDLSLLGISSWGWHWNACRQ